MRHWFAIALVFLGAGTAIGGWVANLPRVRNGLGLSVAELGLALPAMAFGALLATFFAARLARRFGSGRCSIVAGLMLALTVTGPAFARGYPSLGLALLVLGLAAGTAEVCMNALGSELEQRHGRALMSSFHCAHSVGILSGLTLGGAIASVGGSTRLGGLGPALIIAVAVSLAAMLCLWRMPRTDTAKPSDGPVGGTPFGLAALRRLKPSVGLSVLGGSLALAMILQNGATDWSSVFSISVLGMTEAVSGTGFGCFLIALAVSRLAGDWLVGLLGPIKTLRVGAGVAAAGYVLLVLVPEVWWVCTGLVIVGLGVGNLAPVIYGLVGRADQHPARAMAVAIAIAYLGAMCGPIVIGALANTFGLHVAFVVLSLVSLLLATVLPSLIERTSGSRLTS